MRRDRTKTCEPKARHRVRNCAACNADLINRGNVVMWIDKAVLASAPDFESRCGRPRLDSDALIQALRTVFRMPLARWKTSRNACAAWLSPPCPCRTTRYSAAAPALGIRLPIVRDVEPVHLVVNSTGAKVYRESEWKVRQHGYSKRRTWRNVPLALDANHSQVRAALMTCQGVAGGDVLAELLDQIPDVEQLAQFLANGP
ncbi:transposase [Burkholderia sp. MSMB1552]|uniref:transposase n=2 Tax=unclassified Burkholderia TaxID=2613784 RepID=UPI0009E744B0|nr:transposase [Burkholderia sp. MSMB1552]